MSLLDEALAHYDVNEVHDTWVDAPPAAAWEAVRAVTAAEVRLLVPLMTLRSLPGLLLRRRAPALSLRTPVLEAMKRNGFLVLGERPGEEVVLGVAGRFWALAGSEGVRRLASPEAFASFAEPGSARAAANFEIVPAGGGARVRTETRIAGTDAAGTRAFRRYWRVVYPGSAAIRVSWLNAIRRRAERARPSVA